MSDIPINLTANLTPDEQYLWDGTGTPDPLTIAIESALGAQRYSGGPLKIGTTRRGRRPLVALAAALLLAAALAVYFLRPHRPPPAYADWALIASTGKPAIGYLGPSKLPDAFVKTDASSTATLQYKQGPTVQIASSSEAVLSWSPEVHLSRGEASVDVPMSSAPVAVGTPLLTCTLAPGSQGTVQFTDGSSRVAIKSGWAEVSTGFERLRLSDTTACDANPKSGTIWPPYRLAKDANSAALTKQIDDLLHGQGKLDEKTRYMILSKALEQAQPADAELLWNLLSRVDEGQRQPIRNRLAKIVKNPPKGEAFDAVLKLDKDALEAWWNAVMGR